MKNKEDAGLLLGGMYGNSPEVNADSMRANNRVVTSANQAVELTNTDINDARNLIKNSKRITAAKQGAPPYNRKALKDQGKSWKRNISTRFLQKELNRAAPRLYMPILTASTMTAAELPSGWPKGQEKTQFFRNAATKFIKSWRKNDMFWRGLKQEVVDYGFGFAVWTNPNEWRPHMCRMDRGFVPRGTEVMDDKIARFTLKWDYRPDELLGIVRDAIAAGSENWNKDSVAHAVDYSTLPQVPADGSGLRKWEELVREQVITFNTTRSQRMIETRHLYVLEYSGKVSHYILWPDGKKDDKLLFEHLDAYDSMDEVVVPVVFGYGDGTIHGSWGAGQLLYDLSAQVERIRCDSIDNLLNSNKARLQVPNAKDAAAAQLVVNDTMIIATGATFAQNIGGISGEPKGYLLLDDRMSRWAQEIVGSYLPPMPSQSSRAATDIANEAINNEQQVQKDVLENSLKQDALIIANMLRRASKSDSDDDAAKEFRKSLLGSKDNPTAPILLTEEEIDLLVNQPVIQSVAEFTEYAASQRGAFAASVQNNPLYNQGAVARYMANGVPNAGSAFVDSIVAAEGDVTSITAQQRLQMMESTSMLVSEQALPILPTDLHIEHWKILDPQVEQAIQGGKVAAAAAGLNHLAGHYAAAVATKTIPPDMINPGKARLGQLQRALEAKVQEQADAQVQAEQAAGAQGTVEQMPMAAV